MADAFDAPSMRDLLRAPFATRENRNRTLTGVALLFLGMFVPLLPGLVVYGYAVRIMQQAIHAPGPDLPEWKDWGRLLWDGLRSWVIGLVYLAPGLLIGLCGMLAYFGIWFGTLINTGRGGRADIDEVFLPWLLLAMVILFGSIFLSWFLSLLGAVPLPLALAHFAAEDRLGAAFNLRGIGRRMGADPWGYFLGWVITFGLGAVLYLAFVLIYTTLILCFFAPWVIAPFGFYLMVVGAGVFGRHYRAAAPASA